MTVQPVSNADEARARAERIREGIRAMASWADDVRTAWLQRDDRVLGYPSWADYLRGEFDMLPRLSKAQRDAAMVLLSEAGMPVREIGATAGAGKSTVARTLVPNGTEPKGEGMSYSEAENAHGDFENACFTDPSGGIRDLRDILKNTDRFLANYYRYPAPHQIDVIQAWLDKNQRKVKRARKDTPS